MSKYLPDILEQFKDIEKEDIIKLFVSSEFNPMLDYYQKSYDLNASVSSRDRERGDRDAGRDRGRSRDRNDENKQRFHVNQGEEGGLNKGAVLRLVCQHSDISSGEVGRIDLFREFSFFEVDKKFADQVLQGMRDAEFNGEGLKVEFAGDKKGGSGDRGGSRGASRGGSRGGDRGGSRGGGGYKGGGGGSRSGGGSSHRKGNSGGTGGGGGGDRSRRRRG